jgi:hypothetical protein
MAPTGGVTTSRRLLVESAQLNMPLLLMAAPAAEAAAAVVALGVTDKVWRVEATSSALTGVNKC